MALTRLPKEGLWSSGPAGLSRYEHDLALNPDHIAMISAHDEAGTSPACRVGIVFATGETLTLVTDDYASLLERLGA